MLWNCGVGKDSWGSLGLQGDQSWMFIGSTDAEAEAWILWPPDVKNWLIGKNSDTGKDWRQEEKGTTEDEMVGWYHRLNGHEFEQALGVVDGQGSLACCTPWGRKESDTTEWLNWTELSWTKLITWITSFSNSMKLWTMPCRATQHGWTWWRVLTKHGLLESGRANRFSILALWTPWTVWKGRNI